MLMSRVVAVTARSFHPHSILPVYGAKLEGYVKGMYLTSRSVQRQTLFCLHCRQYISHLSKSNVQSLTCANDKIH